MLIITRRESALQLQVKIGYPMRAHRREYASPAHRQPDPLALSQSELDMLREPALPGGLEIPDAFAQGFFHVTGRVGSACGLRSVYRGQPPDE
jgi:hypothetical protein